MSNGPDFFIVGAPKCGTSALDGYLRDHPDIFMAPKERHFFGSDLVFAAWRPNAEQYFALFPEEGQFAARGDASVGYLYSQRAAEEIHAYNPQSRIIVMLRNPVDMIYSMHSQMLYSGAEDIPDFAEALAAEADRRQGRRIPPDNGNPWALQYRDVGRYSEQVRRYIEVFGREQVHVVFFEDFRADTKGEYARVLAFLGVGPWSAELAVVNANKRMRSETIRHLVRSLNRPSPLIRKVGRAFFRSQRSRDRVDRVRVGLTDTVTNAIVRANTKVAPRTQMAPTLRAELTREFTPDVLALAELLGRNLDDWVAPEARSVVQPV